jgi:c(7)-type cytochrome triheme protein
MRPGIRLAVFATFMASCIGAGAGLFPRVSGNSAAQDDTENQEEEHGGDILFHVVSRIQPRSVIYSHEAHLAAGLDCEDCHTRIFEKEFGGNHFKMKDINKGQACGICHQAEPPAGVLGAFPPKDNCHRCHTVRVRDPEK